MAISKYKKGQKKQLSSNFKSTEFDCHGTNCCSETLIDQNLVSNLQKIRNHFGKPLKINSGYRCETHNSSVGGATGSRHTKGMAADFYIDGVTPREIAQYAESIGIKGIGLYEAKDCGDNFVHIDTRTTKSFWYGHSNKPVDTFIEKENKVIDTSKIDKSPADPKKVWDYLKKSGLSDCGIAGLMGNLYAESGLRPTNLQNSYEKKIGYTDVEYTAATDQGIYTNFVRDSAGYGLAQWTYWSRKQALLDFCQKKNTSIGDLYSQLDFLVEEISKNYKTVWNVLKTSNNVIEASNAVLIDYESPADQGLSVQNTRAKYGQDYYDKYAKKETPKPQIPQDPPSEEKIFEPYMVRVTASALNYRSGPGKNYRINGVVRKNQTYTIVEEKNGWGKLKSGAGWIHLDYVKKI